MRPPPVALALAAAVAVAASADEAWRELERLRSALAADGPLSATFQQAFVPAGFAAGDTESGVVALSLPDCLRWDYRDPYPKSFLVCGDRAWSWVEGEPRGHRFTIEAERETGLDLLLLPAAELAARYRSQTSRTTGGELEIVLEPLAEGGDLVVANLVLDGEGRRPRALEWRDREGNVTSFRFDTWRELEDGERFTPPPGLEWSDPGGEEVR